MALQIKLSRSQNLWAYALQGLNEDDRSQLDFLTASKLNVLQDALSLAQDKQRECLASRWKIKRGHGKVVILREVFEKIAKWIHKFKEAGDIAVQYDPAHAALPWAAVRFLLQVAINDNDIFAAMLEGLERVSSLVTRYALFEEYYLQMSSPAVDILTESLVALYAAILEFLGKALHFFGQNTAKRAAKNVFNFSDATFDTLMNQVHQKQQRVDWDAQLVNAERQQQTSARIDLISRQIQAWTAHESFLSVILDAKLEDQRRMFVNLIQSLNEPISRKGNLLTDRADYVPKTERNQVLHWLCPLSHEAQHERKRQNRLASSGSWMFQNPEFTRWKTTTYSTILWIHGPPGFGKSTLISAVIDEALREGKHDTENLNSVAYFYCARDPAEPERANPLYPLLSIARQLSGSQADERLRAPAHQAFLRSRRKATISADIRLNMRETVELILELTFDNPATIIVDGIDECDPMIRHELLESLDTIVQHSSNIIKMLVSSRDDVDLACKLEVSPNLYISAACNRGDIDRYVEREVDEAIHSGRLPGGQLYRGKIREVISVLADAASGRFTWINLQLQNLCTCQSASAIDYMLQTIKRKPGSLADLYDLRYAEILNSDSAKREVGINTLKWLIGTKASLSANEICDAVTTPGVSSTAVTLASILQATCNLVVYYRSTGVLAFAHLTVREYLERREEYEFEKIHTYLTRRCVSALLNMKGAFHRYASLYWLEHYAEVQDLFLRYSIVTPIFDLFWGNLKAFHAWQTELSLHPTSVEYGHRRFLSQENPFLIACEQSMRELIEELCICHPQIITEATHKNFLAKTDPYHGMNGLHIAIFNSDSKTVSMLLDYGMRVDICTLRGEQPLHLVARLGYVDILGVLLNHKPSIDALSYQQRTSSNEFQQYRLTYTGDSHRSPSALGHRKLNGDVLSFLDRDAEGALHAAARKGYKECVELLLKHGASVDLKSRQSLTPLYWAKERKHPNIEDLLKDNGASEETALIAQRRLIVYPSLPSRTEEDLAEHDEAFVHSIHRATLIDGESPVR